MTDQQGCSHEELNNNNFHETPFNTTCQRARSLRIGGYCGVKQCTFCKS